MPTLTAFDPQSISGAPSPPPPLSGLLFGTNLGLSGGQDLAAGGLAGGPLRPGIQGGLGLDVLSLLTQLTQSGEGGGAAIPNLNLLQGALGQAPGGFGSVGGGAGVQSPFFQQSGQQGRAGQTAGATGGTSGDLLSVLKSALSVGQKGTDLFAALTGGAPGTDLQLGRGQVGGFSLFGQPGPASPTTGGSGGPLGDLGGQASQFAVQNLLTDPTLRLFTRGLLQGSLTPETITQFETLPKSLQQQFVTALTGGPITGDLGSQLQAGTPSGFSLGVPPLSTTGGSAPGLSDLLPAGLSFKDLSGVLGLLGGGASLGRDIQSKSPAGIAQDIVGLFEKAVPLINQQFGTQIPTLKGIGIDLLNQAAPNLSASLGLSPLGATIGATGVGVGSAFAPAAQLGATASELSSLGATGAELAGGLGAALSPLSILGSIAGPFISGITTGISDIAGGDTALRKEKEAFIQKGTLGAVPRLLAQARAAASGSPQQELTKFTQLEPFFLSPIQRDLARRFEEQVGGLMALEQLGGAQSIAGRRKFGLPPFPNLGLGNSIQQLGRIIVSKAFAAQQALQAAGVTPEMLRQQGVPLAFGPEGIHPATIERFGLEPSEGGGEGSAQTVPVGNVFLNDVIARHLAQVYGITGPIPNFGPVSQPGTPEFDAAFNAFKFRPANKVGGGNVLGFPDFRSFFLPGFNEATLAP